MSKKKKESKKGSASSVSGWPSTSGVQVGGALPEATKSRLWELFGAIEHEFENLYSENAACKFDQVSPRAVRVSLFTSQSCAVAVGLILWLTAAV